MRSNSGMTFMELMVVVALLSVVGVAGMILFNSSQSIWGVTNARVQMQQDMRQALHRLSAELQESGIDHLGALQVSVFSGSGPNGSDILRFSVPLCLCGTSPMDDSGNVRNWGASLTWGQSGCSSDYPLESNGKVKICHLPPGNPSNKNTLNVNVNAVKAHLAHGDWIGACNACDPAVVSYKYLEYRIDANGNFIRRVLNTSAIEVASSTFAQNVTDFQASVNGSLSEVNVSITFSDTWTNRVITVTDEMDVKLRNIN